MATKRRLGLRVTRPIKDPTGLKKAQYLLALNEGWQWWHDPLIIRTTTKQTR